MAERWVEVANIVVGLSAPTQALLSLGPTWERFEIPQRTPHATVEVDVAPPRACEGRLRFDSGGVWRLYESGSGALELGFYSRLSGALPYRRLETATGFQHSRLTVAAPPTFPLEYPLDEVLYMHHFSQTNAVELHASGVQTRSGRGLLFVGHSGAGKSTAAALWTAHAGASVLSDDRIVVRPAGAAATFFGTPWHGSAQLARAHAAPLEHIFLLEQAPACGLERLRASTATVELLARAFYPVYDPIAAKRTAETVAALAAVVPVSRFRCTRSAESVDFLAHALSL